MRFYNRQTEITELRALSQQAHTGGGLMSVIVGRRRVGKTRLLRQTYQDTDNHLYLFCSQKARTPFVRRIRNPDQADIEYPCIWQYSALSGPLCTPVGILETIPHNAHYRRISGMATHQSRCFLGNAEPLAVKSNPLYKRVWAVILTGLRTIIFLSSVTVLFLRNRIVAARSIVSRITSSGFGFTLFTYRHQTTVEIGNYPYIKQYIKRHFNTFTGMILEQMFTERLIESREFTQIGRYWEKNNQNELDIVAVNESDKTILIAEVKRQASKINLDLLDKKAQKIRQHDKVRAERLHRFW